MHQTEQELMADGRKKYPTSLSCLAIEVRNALSCSIIKNTQAFQSLVIPFLLLSTPNKTASQII